MKILQVNYITGIMHESSVVIKKHYFLIKQKKSTNFEVCAS